METSEDRNRPMEARQTTIERLIQSAVTAGALSAGARAFPECQGGLERAWEWHHQRVQTLVADICHAADPARSAAAGMTTTRK
jgi:hypothetical protein